MITRAAILTTLLFIALFGGWAAQSLATAVPATPAEEAGTPAETQVLPTETVTHTPTTAPPTGTPKPSDTPVPPTDTRVATETGIPQTPTPESSTGTPEPPTSTSEASGTPGPDLVSSDAVVEGVLFFDDFETGDLRRWTSQSGMGVQQDVVAGGGWAARATTAEGAAALSRLTLPSSQPELFVQVRFKIVSQGNNEATLLHLRSADSGTLLSVFVTPAGRLAIRSDVANYTLGSATYVEKEQWYELQAGLTIDGAQGLTNIFLDGIQIPDLSVALKTGAVPIGRVELGERSSYRVLDIAFDDITVATDPLPALIQPVEPTPTVAPALEFVPVADARVDEGAPNTNYGRSTTLRVDGGREDDVESYLMFDVTGVTAPVSSATLRVYATSGSRDGPDVSTGDSTWSEREITWKNRPARTSGTIFDAATVASNSWIDLNVSGAVTSDGLVTFVLHTDVTDGVSMSAREGANSPQLVLTFGSDEPLPTPPVATETTTAEETSTEVTAPTVTSTGTVESSRTPSPTSTRTPRPTPTATQISGETAILLAAGDIASCGENKDELTGALAASLAGEILVLGDLAYDAGSASQFANCYDPSWGGVKDRTHPVPGNHEYGTGGARAYFDYFGAAAGDPGKGYYSFNAGEWHIVALNSNCAEIGGCGTGSAQEKWLRADLIANPTRCTLAFWHHPMYSSGDTHGSHIDRVGDLWNTLYQYGAEIVLSGHDHLYERFSPQDASSSRDTSTGIRQFVVGTGGKGLYSFGGGIANSEVRNDRTFGVLRLILRPAGYDWEFVPVSGSSFTDSGSGTCHGSPSGTVSSDVASVGADILAQAYPAPLAVMPTPPQSRSRALRRRIVRQRISSGNAQEGGTAA